MYIYYKHLCSLSCTMLIAYMFMIVYNIITAREQSRGQDNPTKSRTAYL